MWHPWKRGELHTILVGKLERKRPLGRLGCRWEDNIKVYLNEVRYGASIVLNQLRLGPGGGQL
jgi:hypothetical protein